MVTYRAVLIPLPFVVHINDVQSTVAGIIQEFEDVRNGLQHLLYNINGSSRCQVESIWMKLEEYSLGVSLKREYTIYVQILRNVKKQWS